MLGCLVGQDAYTNGVRFGAGAWSGKCLKESNNPNGNRVINLLTPLPSIGGMMTVLDTFNWTSFSPPVIEQYPGQLTVGSSWWDAYYSLPSGGRVKNVWTITYDDVPPPQIDANSTTLERTMAVYSQLVRGSRDEMRLISPGFVLGQVFRRPNSYLNPTPFPINNGIRFALFQMCDKSGNYPSGGNQRNFRT